MGTSLVCMAVLLAAIGLIVFLIMRVRIHAFVALIVACVFVGFASGMGPDKIVASIEGGMAGILGFLATILGLGTILGKMLEISGGAERLARTIVGALGERNAQWAMMIVAFIAGIPVFFQVGFVLLIPLVWSLAAETGLSAVAIGMPMTMSLLTVHCMIPPHPAAMAITLSLHGDVGKVIGYGLLVGLPVAVVSGPFWMEMWKRLDQERFKETAPTAVHHKNTELPGFWITLATVLLPLAIMMLKTVLDWGGNSRAGYMTVVNFIGTPMIALLISVFTAYWTLGLARGFSMKQLTEYTEQCFGPVAGILLIIGGGGAFNRVLVDSGMGKEIAGMLTGLHMDPIIMSWLVAIMMRFSVGSATVAMMTAAGIMGPVLQASPGLDPAYAIIAIGAGAIGLSHVNDSGFWIVKEYLQLPLPAMFRYYTLATTVAAVVGLVGVLVLIRIVG